MSAALYLSWISNLVHLTIKDSSIILVGAYNLAWKTLSPFHYGSVGNVTWLCNRWYNVFQYVLGCW